MQAGREEVTVVEWLQTKWPALFAIGFALFTLFLLGSISVEQLAYHRGFLRRDPANLIVFLIPAGIGILELVVTLMVINNTWRRTILEARREGVLLRFTTPFGRRQYEWGASDIEEVRLELTTKPTDANRLGELQIHVAAQPVAVLFTDHDLRELTAIVHAVREALRLDAPLPHGARPQG